MLKKQTVWLLTMLSLMIVLSVYYLNAPSEGDLAYYETDEELGSDQEQATSSPLTDNNEENVENTDQVDEAEGEMGASTDPSEYFAAVRMEIMNQRSMEKERLENIVASNESSSDEKNVAYEAMKEIEMLDQKERILEDSIKSLKDYEQVLVRHASEGNAVVTVQTDSLSTTEANEIIQQAKDELGEINIEVVYKPS